MIEVFIRGMLGPFVPVLDFIEQNPIAVALILAVWLSIYVAGRVQLSQIERRTAALVLERSRTELAARPNISAISLYKKIYPLWEAELKKWGFWFIPHRLDLWPVPVKPATVLQKMTFSPEWIEQLLKTHEIVLVEKTPEKKTSS